MIEKPTVLTSYPILSRIRLIVGGISAHPEQGYICSPLVEHLKSFLLLELCCPQPSQQLDPTFQYHHPEQVEFLLSSLSDHHLLAEFCDPRCCLAN